MRTARRLLGEKKLSRFFCERFINGCIQKLLPKIIGAVVWNTSECSREKKRNKAVDFFFLVNSAGGERAGWNEVKGLKIPSRMLKRRRIL